LFKDLHAHQGPITNIALSVIDENDKENYDKLQELSNKT